MEKRGERRIKKSLLVDISRNGLQQMGVTVNISRRGICIATTEIFRRRSRLQILLAAAADIYALTGTVVWHVRGKALPGVDVPVGIGVRIRDAEPGYYKYIAAMRQKRSSLPRGGLSC